MPAAGLGGRATVGFVIRDMLGRAADIGVSASEENLLLTNRFLTLVNLVGIGRWLEQTR